jgi:hypothetical protein
MISESLFLLAGLLLFLMGFTSRNLNTSMIKKRAAGKSGGPLKFNHYE